MQERIVNDKIDCLKPNMKVLRSVEQIQIVPNQTLVSAKADGEMNLLVYNQNGESYTLNKWGRKRSDFPALNEFVIAMKQTDVETAEVMVELYAEKSGKPLSLPNFIHYVKSHNPALISKVHIGIWDLLSVNGKSLTTLRQERYKLVESWLENLQLVKRNPLVKVLPYITPESTAEIEQFWREKVVEQGWEGLVVRTGNEISKLKPSLEVDAVIIGINRQSGYGKDLRLFDKKEVSSIKLALMQPDGTFIELSDCASGITRELRKSLWKLMDYKVGETDKTVYIKPIVVCTIQYTDTYIKDRQVLKFDGEKYTQTGMKQFVSLRHPRLVAFRPDKGVNPQHLSTTQIPEGKPLKFVLYQDDCRRILPTLKSESIDLIVTSPPYWKVKQYAGVEGEIGTKGSADQYREDLIKVFTECYRLLNSSGVFCLNLDRGGEVSAWEFIPQLKTIGFHLIDTIIWYDKSRRREMRYLSHSYEPIFILTKTKNFTFNKFNPHQNDVWEIIHHKGITKQKGDAWDRTGVATFPVELVEKVINLYSNPNDTVLDPFAGSGSVLDVSQRLGRNSIAIEISAEYCQTIMQRCFDKHPQHKYIFNKFQNSV